MEWRASQDMNHEGKISEAVATVHGGRGNRATRGQVVSPLPLSILLILLPLPWTQTHRVSHDTNYGVHSTVMDRSALCTVIQCYVSNAIIHNTAATLPSIRNKHNTRCHTSQKQHTEIFHQNKKHKNQFANEVWSSTHAVWYQSQHFSTRCSPDTVIASVTYCLR